MSNIIFVDQNDNVIGAGTKHDALEKGIIHRIVRVFLIDSQGKILIQKRARTIALPGRWDQSAAGHVDEGEINAVAARREMVEEIGVENAVLKEVGKVYTEEDDESRIKKRFNVLYFGKYDGKVKFNEEEVSEVRWVLPKELNNWMNASPNDFTQGFIICFKQFLKLVK